MSSNIFYEFGFACSHIDCKYKSRKFNSIDAINMHYAKAHSKTQRLEPIKDSKGRLRLILRMK